MTQTTARRRALSVLGTATALALTLAACSTGTDSADTDTSDTETSAEEDHDHEGEEDHDHEEEMAATDSSTEQSAPTPRLVVTYDGGVQVLDATTLEVIEDFPLDGFNRVNPVGDGRHVALSTQGGFAVVDAGTWSQAHGDHFHYYTADPALSDVIIEAETPGHVVPHDDLTAIWDDATGHVTVVETGEWTEMVEHEHVHAIREWTAPEAHHGVAVATEEGNLLVTIGDSESRTGAMILDENNEVIVSSEECPGVHGETAFDNAGGEELFVVGCDDGVLVFHGDHAHKLTAEQTARTGNLFSAEGSDVVLGDFRVDPEGGLGMGEVAVINTSDETITAVDPFDGSGALYTFRDLARGEDGELLVLGTDGTLRVLDESGALTTTIDVIGEWDIPEEWQTAHPAVKVLDGMAYVTEPATGSIHIVDYVGGEVWKSVEVGTEVNEIAGVTG